MVCYVDIKGKQFKITLYCTLHKMNCEDALKVTPIICHKCCTACTKSCDVSDERA